MISRPLHSLLPVVMLGSLACANFRLADDSRLPKWFSPPKGITREHIRVTVDYGVLPGRRWARFTMFDRNGHQLGEVTGTMTGSEPLVLDPSSPTRYEVIVVDGVTEVLEHKKPGPELRVSDDAEVQKRLNAIIEDKKKN